MEKKFSRRFFIQNLLSSAAAFFGTFSFSLPAWALRPFAFWHADGKKLYSWGNNVDGQLGNGTSGSNTSVPTQIGTDRNWKKIACGNATSYAIKTNGTLWVWGRNNLGQLGDGTTTPQSSPVQLGTDQWTMVDGLLDVAHAIKKDGTLWGWGGNGSGQVGDNTSVAKSSPVQVTIGFTDFKYIGHNLSSSFAIRKNGDLWAWGKNDKGQLGDGTTVNRSSPVQIAGSWKKVLGGTSFAMGLKSDGTLYTWGFNNVGQLGDGTCGTKSEGVAATDNSANKSSPVQIGTETYKDIASNWRTGLGIRTDGTLWAWGNNQNGSLGNNTIATPSDSTTNYTTDKSSPTQIGADTDWAYLIGTEMSVMAVKTNGSVYSWGRGGSGQLGTTPSASWRSHPTLVPLLPKPGNSDEFAGGGHYHLFLRR